MSKATPDCRITFISPPLADPPASVAPYCRFLYLRPLHPQRSVNRLLKCSIQWLSWANLFKQHHQFCSLHPAPGPAQSVTINLISRSNTIKDCCMHNHLQNQSVHNKRYRSEPASSKHPPPCTINQLLSW